MDMELLAPEGLQELPGAPPAPQSLGNTHNIGFNCCEASPDLCHAHGNPAGSKVEDSVPSCRHQMHPAGHREEAEEQGGSSHVSCLGDLPKEENISLYFPK